MKLASVLFLLAAFAYCSTFPSALNARPPGATPQHAKLKELEGKWNFTLKTSDGAESIGVSNYKLECDGLWLTSDFNCKFGGVPFQGKGLDGYDPEKKKYVSVWVDSMTPVPMIFEGQYDSTGKILTMEANAAGPDGKPAKWRSISKMVNADEHTFEMLVTPMGGSETSMMVVTYNGVK